MSRVFADGLAVVQRLQHSKEPLALLDAAGDAQGGDHERGMLQVGADIGHRAGDGDVFSPQGQHFRAGASPDHIEPGLRCPRRDEGHDLPGKPLRSVGVGVVVHGAGKDDGHFVSGIG